MLLLMTIESYQKAYLVMLLFIGITFSSYGQGKSAEKQIYVVFRYDDYSANSITGAELKIIDAFRNSKAAVTFGVIPFKVAGDVHDPSPQDLLPLDSVKGEILKTGYEEGILDISMHGYAHQSNGTEPLSEFANLAYKDQVGLLLRGREFLQNMTGARVTTFIPPWNTYDKNTLSALEETGFSTISAAKKGMVDKGSNLNFLPFSCTLTGLQDAIRAARKSSDNQPLMVVLIHDYDFLDFNPEKGEVSIQDFTNLIDWVSAQEDVRIISFSQAIEIIKDLGADRALRAKRIYYAEKLPPLSLGGAVLLYRESPGLAMTLLKIAALYSILITIGLVLFYRIIKKLFKQVF
jgi:hypothetical protein